MRPIWILVALFAFGCAQTDRPTPTDTSEAQNGPSVTLDNLSYDDPSSSDTQYPLVCGVDRDFPNGRELAFRNSQSREFVHAVFPEGVTPPKDPSGKFVLHGHYQGIQNRKSYTLKQPPENYRYFLVSSWKQKK